jgi:hypothetical protein
MACDYCSIDRVTHYEVLTRLNHRVNLCEACARLHGIVSDRLPKETLEAKRELAQLEAGESPFAARRQPKAGEGRTRAAIRLIL